MIIYPNIVLEGFSMLPQCKWETGLCWSLNEDVEFLKGSLLTEFLETSICSIF